VAAGNVVSSDPSAKSSVGATDPIVLLIAVPIPSQAPVTTTATTPPTTTTAAPTTATTAPAS